MARDAGLLTRQRLSRFAPWLAGAVLLAGIGAFVADRLDGGSGTSAGPSARVVAREFVATAVARTNLARSYALAAPELRGSHTLADWKTGSIPVVPYPVAKARATYTTQLSTATETVLRVSFAPKSGTDAQAADFLLTLRRENGHWLVSSWAPRSLIGAHG